ncbi:MAG: hypothetical protein KC417_09975, partial [Myxococcales bacterium]|nr:hypothetical protein [Myxococcales bacterium]
MSALTSLLVRDQILSVRKIEQALERQVTDGGDLETILLEMDVVQENVPSAYRAVLFGLLPGTRDEVMKAPPEVTGLVPKDLALKHNFVPLSSDGKLIVIALAEPLSIDARREVQKVLDQEIAYRVVTPIRVIAGLAQHYGRELDAKFRRLIDRLQDRAPGIVPYVAPPPTGGRVAAPTPVVGLRAQQPVAPPSGSPTSPGSVRARRRSHGHWGPLTANQAAKRLDVLSDRDEILDLYLVFASQFLEYVAVFVVQGDLASGRDALGNGPDGEYLRGLAVPLDVPGSFAEVRSMRVPAVVDLTKSELDRIVATDLDRVAAQPSLLVPVVLRGRVVAFLYGDRAGERFTLSDVPEVLGLSVRVGDALERGILARKGIATPMHVLPEHDAGPTPSVVPRTRTTPPESVRRPEPGPHDVLGVPRSAPPPPKRSQVPVEAKAPEPSPVPRVEPSIHPNAAEPRRSAPPTVGSYHVHSALPEVVETRPSRAPGGRASARPAERASVRPAETPSAEPVARASVRPLEAAPPASSPPVSPASVSVPPASNPPVSNPPRASGAPRRQSARPDPRREDGT